MDYPISAADANRKFSSLLREVRESRASYVVTSHGRPVARIVPVDEDNDAEIMARELLLRRLAGQPASEISPWTRDELYEDEP